MDEHAQNQDPVAPGMCPTGCGQPKPLGKLMCLTCWREVPDHLKADVMRTWRTYRKAAGSSQRIGKTAARETYVAARDAAIASIR